MPRTAPQQLVSIAKAAAYCDVTFVTRASREDATSHQCIHCSTASFRVPRSPREAASSFIQ